MPSTRSSARLAEQRSSPASSQGTATSSGTKRKSDASPESKATAKSRKPAGKKQKTMEETIPEITKDHAEEAKEKEDTEMKDAPPGQDGGQSKQNSKHGGEDDTTTTEKADIRMEEPAKEETTMKEDSAARQKETAVNGSSHGAAQAEEEREKKEKEEEKGEERGGGEKAPEPGVQPEEAAAPTKSDGEAAIQQSSEREKTTPSSVLEKGIFYFFARGRVGIDSPASIADIARSYIVLRPLPHGAAIGPAPIPDGGHNRVLALPKKTLPQSSRDRFMTFVELSGSGLPEIRDRVLSADDYETKTAGTRHVPAPKPLAEGVYALVRSGGDKTRAESHLAYMLTLPAQLGSVQRDLGLREQGSFVASVRNPQFEAPPNAALPKGPEFSQEILDEFRTLRWTPAQPKHLDYQNAQILLIGSGDAAKVGDKTDNAEEDKPIEELEKLENEDESRIEHLKGDDAVFADLGLSKGEYPKMETTW